MEISNVYHNPTTSKPITYEGISMIYPKCKTL